MYVVLTVFSACLLPRFFLCGDKKGDFGYSGLYTPLLCKSMSQEEERVFYFEHSVEHNFPVYFMVNGKATVTLWCHDRASARAALPYEYYYDDFPRFVNMIAKGECDYQDLPAGPCQETVRQTLRSLKARGIQLDKQRTIHFQESAFYLKYCIKIRYGVDAPRSRKRGRECHHALKDIPVKRRGSYWSAAIKDTAFQLLPPDIMAHYIFPMMLQATIDASDHFYLHARFRHGNLALIPIDTLHLTHGGIQHARIKALLQLRLVSGPFRALIDVFYPAIITHLPALTSITCSGCNKPIQKNKKDAFLNLLYTAGEGGHCALVYEHNDPDYCSYGMKAFMDCSREYMPIGSSWFRPLSRGASCRVILNAARHQAHRTLQAQRAILMNQMDSPILLRYITDGPCARYVD